MAPITLLFQLLQRLPFFAAVIATVYIGYLLVHSIYNVFFHPLRKFPGPKLAAATPIPFMWGRAKAHQHLWIESLHEQYGPVVRFLPDHVSFLEPVAWKDIFGHKINGRGDMPKDKGQISPLIGGTNSIISMDDANHSRVRRLLAHALSDKALREQQEILDGYVQKLIRKIKSVAESPTAGAIDMATWYTFCTFDIISDLSFGESLGMLDEGNMVPWIAAINASIPLLNGIVLLKRWFPPIGWLYSKFLPASYMAPFIMHREYSIAQVDKRMARKTERPDFWKYILRNQGKENGSLTKAESHAMGMTLMIAGSETTATLLSGVTNLLLRNPDKYELLKAEIRGAYSSPSDITIDNLSRLPYIQACLEETLRLYPSVALGQQRAVPAGGRMVGDRFVPEGTIVTISHWSAYRYPAHWHRPEEFLPERWLPENQKAGPFANDRRDVFHPFSYGPRNCIGVNLAYHEARLILANVVWHFDLDLFDKTRDWAKGQKVYGVPSKPPLMVQPSVRKDLVAA